MLGSQSYPRRKLWTSEEAARLTEMFPDQRYELIEGELWSKMGQKPPHAYVIAVLTSLFVAAFPDRVRIQSSIHLPSPENQHSEPEPDVVLLRVTNREFSKRHPGPNDIALLIEVADTTLQFDRSVKASLYARSGVPEYWIFDIQGNRIMTHRDPAGSEFRSIRIFEATEEVSPQAEPAFQLSFQQLS